jgi:vanillate O-demethylase monooxygenase subunit
MFYAPAAVPDYAELKKCWHPVKYSHLLQEKPSRVRLLGHILVIWRSSDGHPHAMEDMCIHRGAALSQGVVDRDEILCPYHGWRYGKNGVCTAIPQLEDPSIVPSKAKVPSYFCQERYGIIWVALEEPRWPLPEIPELESHDRSLIFTGPYPWQADSSRQLENFTDFAHFPWVHPGLLGDPNKTIVPRYTVETDGRVLRYEITRPEAPRNEEFPVFFNEQQSGERHSQYQLYLPYTIVMRQDWGGEEQMIHLFCSQPVDRNMSIGYSVIGRNYYHDQDPEIMKRFEDTAFNQDKEIVELQRPEFVPFDLADELHMRFDAVAVSYRKAMRDQGLAKRVDAPPAAG